MTEPEADPDAEPGDDVPVYGSAPEPVGMREGRSRTERVLHLLAANLHLVAGVALGAGAVGAVALDVQLSRSQTVLAGTFVVGLVLFGYPAGRKAAELMGGPRLVWLVDVDLLDREGAGIVTVPTPRWRDEWEVIDGELWWATPELAFGKKADLTEQTVEGTWPGTLPEPVVARALSYIHYNREVLLEAAEAGEMLDVNAHAIIRDAVKRETSALVRTFEAGTLPDDNEAFRKHVDEVLSEWGVEDSPFRPEDAAERPEAANGEDKSESVGADDDGWNFDEAVPAGGELDG